VTPMFRYLLEKEFRQFFRNSFVLRFVLFFPVVALVVFPLAANFEIKNIALAVVDSDRSEASRRLAEKAFSSGYFRDAGTVASYADALALIETYRADIALEIPRGFARALARGETARVMIGANAVNGMKGGLGSAYLSGIVADFGASVVAEEGKAPTAAEARGNAAQARSGSIAISPSYRYNPLMRYTVYMVPAIMVMLLTMFAGFLPALNIVSEKEKGTIEQMNVTPVRKSELILAKLVPYWAVCFVALTSGCVVAALVYGLRSLGGYAILYLFASLFTVAMSGFGLVLSNYAKTIQQAMFMMFFFVITFILISGLYTPLTGMPEWAQVLSHASPLRYMIESFRMIFLKGSGLWELRWRFLALLGFAVFFNGWAILSYRKTD
jgi:ABC-2 type transport system permease protein